MFIKDILGINNLVSSIIIKTQKFIEKPGCINIYVYEALLINEQLCSFSV